MWKLLLLLNFLFCPLFGKEVVVLTHRDLVLLSKETIILEPLRKEAPKVYYNNELVDGFNRPYKRFVFTGSYSNGRDPYNEGGGSACYYLNSFVCVKTGPAYNKINYREKFWKWNAELNFGYPIFPIK